jgi:hypothetical protein
MGRAQRWLAGIRFFTRACTVTTASMPPAAPRVWPMAPLTELTRGPCPEPKTWRRARASARSPLGVAVPWAFQ